MRIVPATAVRSRPTSILAASIYTSPAAIVCSALTLAFVFLALRIIEALVALI